LHRLVGTIVSPGEVFLKTNVLLTVAVLCVATSAHGADFETESWPGEGVPVFAAKNDTLVLHEEPTLTSPTLTIKYKKGRRVLFDKSKVITKTSVMLTANKEIRDVWCKGGNTEIRSGNTVEYLQYRAEGYGTVRVSEKICEVFLEDGFDGMDKSPETEWWVRVVDRDERPFGWILVDRMQLNFLPREF
jgi:hypothetical protein